jgi:uncharacterized membrane protein
MKLAALILSRNYGFMFSVVGRIFFMVLIGIMVSALDTGNGFAYTMAGITIVNAGVNAGVMLYYRDWTADMVEEHTRLTEIQD